MVEIRKTRWGGLLACLLIMVLQVAPATQVMAAKAELPIVKKRIIVFPLALANSVTQLTMGRKMASTMSGMLQNTPGYTVTEFSKRHPSVQRAIQVEKTLLETEIDEIGGVENKANALKVAGEMGGDMIIIGNIDSYRYDPGSTLAEAQVSVQFVEVRNQKIIKNVAVTGKTPDSSKPASEDESAALAAGDAVNKIVEALAIKPPPGIEVADVAKKKTKKKTGLLWIVLGAALGLALVGGGSSTPPDEPLPPGLPGP
ncbi:MAG: hypothetical protein Q7N50_08795 [Armatimonadota bacterium]|nr:hypothetical protein [Armatimonadota bacterium]